MRFKIEPADVPTDDMTITGFYEVATLFVDDTPEIENGELIARDMSIALSENSIGYTEDFAIDWGVQIGNDSLCAGHVSKNTKFTTLTDPLVSPLYHTVIHLACKHAAAQSTEQGAVDGIWSYFQGMVVQNYEDQPPSGFKYWGPAGQGCSVTQCLITNFDGQCGSWARFMRDVLKVHGIAAKVAGILPDESAPGVPQNLLPPHGILVKNHTTTPPFADLPGIPAQGGVADPHSAFLDHALTEWNGQLYDPSYGTGPFPTLLNWQRASLDVVVFSADSQNPWVTVNTGANWALFTKIDSYQP